MIAIIAIAAYVYFCVTYVPAQEAGRFSVLESPVQQVQQPTPIQPESSGAADQTVLNSPQGAGELFQNGQQPASNRDRGQAPAGRLFRRQQAPARSVLSVGGAAGINAGPGQGLRFGPPNAGVQYGGGEGVRFGTPNFGVKYGGGEGVRYGTPNIGVQYGGGQILRWGTPNAGVMVGGGEGIRIGTSRYGLQIGTGHGLQIGRIKQ